MHDNPYSSAATHPIEDSLEERSIEAASQSGTLQSIAKKTFLAWEKLRVLYVAILAAVTFALTGTHLFRDFRLVGLCVEGAVLANIAYFAGPVIETYVRWLGYNRDWPRWVMFVLGTLFTIGLAIVAIAMLIFPINLNALGNN